MAMENTEDEVSSKSNSKSKLCRTAKISLEGYLHFFDSRSPSEFSINHLNQIIAMHGHKRIHKSAKKVIEEAIHGMQLLNPSRSTLSEEISPAESAAASLESVIEDLNKLDWQECTITSVERICPNKPSTRAEASAPKKRRARVSKAKAKAEDKVKDKAKEKPKGSKHVALKPKGNETVPVSDTATASDGKAAKKKKKKCHC